ncbi:hypothetical protein FI667_g14969, partial [Globisporangium splendens]
MRKQSMSNCDGMDMTSRTGQFAISILSTEATAAQAVFTGAAERNTYIERTFCRALTGVAAAQLAAAECDISFLLTDDLTLFATNADCFQTKAGLANSNVELYYCTTVRPNSATRLLTILFCSPSSSCTFAIAILQTREHPPLGAAAPGERKRKPARLLLLWVNDYTHCAAGVYRVCSFAPMNANTIRSHVTDVTSHPWPAANGLEPSGYESENWFHRRLNLPVWLRFGLICRRDRSQQTLNARRVKLIGRLGFVYLDPSTIEIVVLSLQVPWSSAMGLNAVSAEHCSLYRGIVRKNHELLGQSSERKIEGRWKMSSITALHADMQKRGEEEQRNQPPREVANLETEHSFPGNS